MNRTEISLQEMAGVIARRKWLIIISISLCVLVALLYNVLRKPVYQSSVLLKKEVSIEDQAKQDRIENLLALRSQDELETEMQLVQTRGVINNVITELALNILVTKIIEQDGTVTIINLPLNEYQNKLQLGKHSERLPKINRINIGLKTYANKFVIKQDETGKVDLYDGNNNKLIANNNYSEINSNDWQLDYEWPNGNFGEIYFESLNYTELYKEISSNIFTDKKIKTSIFELGVRSNFPYTTKAMANTLAEKFKESRIALQKENISYTFNFIDERLQEVAQNLENAENELSNYKSNEQIANIDEQSKKIIEFLSNLESEKLKNELDLDLYQNKLESIDKQMTNEGYVDQTYLTPEQYQNTDSPFSNLLNELASLELQKLELLQKRTELHPDVVLMNEQISRVKGELGKYNKNTVNAYQIMAGSLNEKQKKLNSLISRYSQKIEDLPNQEATLASLMRKRNAFEKMYTLLLDKREEMRVADLSRMQDIIVLDPAIEAMKPVAPNKKLNLLFAVLFGLVLGFFSVLIAQLSDRKFSDIRDIEKEFNYPILSVIPPFTKKVSDMISTTESVRNRFVTMMEDQFKYKESFRTLETKLASKIKGTPKSVMITSCEENAGKTSVATNLAITIAQSGKKVLLIDCDIKNPSIGELFGLPKFSSGLVDYLTEKANTPNIYKPVKLTKNSNLLVNLDIIPTGKFSNVSGEVLSSERMERLLENMEYYDFVILDTPPITRLSDALSLGRLVKDTVLVIRAGQTIKESISWAIAELGTSDINFVGLLVNDYMVKTSSYKYHYGYENS